MQSIYKNNDRKIRHLGSKRFGIQFLIKGIYTYNGMLYVHTQTKNSSNVPFDTDFIKFKIVDKKVAGYAQRQWEYMPVKVIAKVTGTRGKSGLLTLSLSGTLLGNKDKNGNVIGNYRHKVISE